MSDFYNKYPYTDFHELNLDWVIERVKKLTEDWAATLEEWNATEEEWQQLYDYVHDYFDNLNVQTEINNKLDEMAADGSLAAIVEPIIRSKVNEDLPGIVTLQLPATVSDQIDAVVASQIDDAVAAEIGGAVTPAVDAWLADHITQPTTPAIDTSLSVVGAAADAAAVGDVVADLRSALSYAVNIERNGLTWQQGYHNGNGQIISSPNQISAVTHFPVGSKVHVSIDSGYSYTMTEWTKFGQTYDRTHFRRTCNQIFEIQSPYQIFSIIKGNPNSPDAVDPSEGTVIHLYGIWEENTPDITPSDIELELANGSHGGDMKGLPTANSCVSKILHLTPGTVLYPVIKKPGYRMNISEWHTIGGSYTYTQLLSGGVPYTVQDEYQIVSFYRYPTAATSPDEYHTAASLIDISTDKGAEIMNLFETQDTVNLPAGWYNVTSQIDMPINTSLIGAGAGTEIHANVATCITMYTHNLVKDLTIKGSLTAKPASIGNKIGISITSLRTENRINNVLFSGIDGSSVYIYDTYNVRHLQHAVENCSFEYTGCGVYLGTRAEGCKVSGCSFNDCYQGMFCIGGNNRIVANIFRSCGTAIDMNSDSISNNNGHSVFNDNVIIHNDIGINAVNIINGSIFSGCTLFYSPVRILDSNAFLFIGCELGNPPDFQANNSPGCRLSNCIMTSAGTHTNFLLNNCTNYAGNPIT